MKCLKIGRHHCSLFLFSSFVSIVFCSLFLVSPSFAVDDVSFTLTYDTQSQVSGNTEYYLCGGSTGVSCSSYHYLSVSCSSSSTNYSMSPSVNLKFRSNVFVSLNLFNLHDYNVALPSNGVQVSIYNYPSGIPFPGSCTFTISESNPYDSSDCPVCPDEPSGELAITSNGTYDVTNYASVDVDVPETVVQGDYHNDLQDLKHAVIICGAVLLVIYFFYCIYRMFFRTLGGV